MSGSAKEKRKILIVSAVVLLIYWFLVSKDEAGIPSINDWLTAVAVMLLPSESDMPASVTLVWKDFLVLWIMLGIWLAFFAQFVLPLQNGAERWHAILRLIAYIAGWHGMAASIKNGEVIYRQEEGSRKGWGVIIVDTASAAVLRTPTQFTRAIGPGTHFTKRHEKIAGTVDLHRQSTLIGPRGDENPFSDQGESEADQTFRERKERAWETRAQTRNGVDVIPNIIAIFKLDSEPGEGGTEFGYNSRSVEHAIAYEGAVPSKGKDTQQSKSSWREQPAYIATNLWREYLQKFTLNELFALPGQQVEKTALEKIQSFVNTRMTQKTVDELDGHGNPTGRKIRSREYYLLKSRGIKVIGIIINNLRLHDSVEKKIISQWKAGWMEEAKKETLLVQQKQSYVRHDGEQMALKNFGEYASKLLGDYLITNATTPEQAPDLTQTLELLVRGTLDQCTQDKKLHPHLTNEKSDIVDLVEWIRREQH